MANKQMTPEGYLAPMYKDPGPSATDSGQGRLKTFTEGWDPPNHSDPGPSATDSGSGPAADPGLEGMPTYPNDMDEELGTELILTLKPEVLAQLQRIEDMLVSLLKSHG